MSPNNQTSYHCLFLYAIKRNKTLGIHETYRRYYHEFPFYKLCMVYCSSTNI